eukprot:gene18368-831_t
MMRIVQSEGPPSGIPKNNPPPLQRFFDAVFNRDPKQRPRSEDLLDYDFFTCGDDELWEPGDDPGQGLLKVDQQGMSSGNDGPTYSI